jgi:hypothetical protein
MFVGGVAHRLEHPTAAAKVMALSRQKPELAPVVRTVLGRTWLVASVGASLPGVSAD